MDFLKNIAKDVSKKSGQLVDNTRLSARIATEESKLKDLYTELGERVYKDYQAGIQFDGEFNEFFSDINLIIKGIVDLKDEQADVKGAKNCLNCGAEIKQEAKFCINCGAPQEEVQVDLPKTKICTNCGEELEIDAKFCPECGNTME